MPSAEHTAGVMLVMYHAIANVEVTLYVTCTGFECSRASQHMKRTKVHSYHSVAQASCVTTSVAPHVHQQPLNMPLL